MTAVEFRIRSGRVPRDLFPDGSVRFLLGHATTKREMLLVDDLPGFAGFYKENGRLVVLLKDNSSHLTAARGVIGEFFRTPPRGGSPEVTANLTSQVNDMIARSAVFDFRELQGWRLAIRRTDLSEHGVHGLWINESSNQVVVRIDDESKVREARGAIEDLGVPGEAFRIVVGSRPTDYASNLRSTVTPRIGGIQVSRNTTAACTLGFNVRRTSAGGGPLDFFTTAGHCTDTLGVENSTAFGQPWISSGEIGVEVSDPPLFTYSTNSDCPENPNPDNPCRYSDAALVDYTAGSWTLGVMAWPSEGSIEFTNTKRIGGEYDYLSEGDTVHFVGRTSGRVVAEVGDECMDQWFDGVVVDRWIICTIFVEGEGAGGDSGGPLVSFPLGPTDYPFAVGTLIGGWATQDSTWFSRINLVMSELEQDYGVMT